MAKDDFLFNAIQIPNKGQACQLPSLICIISTMLLTMDNALVISHSSCYGSFLADKEQIDSMNNLRYWEKSSLHLWQNFARMPFLLRFLTAPHSSKGHIISSSLTSVHLSLGLPGTFASTEL